MQDGNAVLSQTLPAGQYAVNAKSVVNLEPNQVATLALQAVIALAETRSVLVLCEAPGRVTQNKLTAIHLTSVN